jgi:hypothetical protein
VPATIGRRKIRKFDTKGGKKSSAFNRNQASVLIPAPVDYASAHPSEDGIDVEKTDRDELLMRKLDELITVMKQQADHRR